MAPISASFTWPLLSVCFPLLGSYEKKNCHWTLGLPWRSRIISFWDPNHICIKSFPKSGATHNSRDLDGRYVFGSLHSICHNGKIFCSIQSYSWAREKWAKRWEETLGVVTPQYCVFWKTWSQHQHRLCCVPTRGFYYFYLKRFEFNFLFWTSWRVLTKTKA